MVHDNIAITNHSCDDGLQIKLHVQTSQNMEIVLEIETLLMNFKLNNIRN